MFKIFVVLCVVVRIIKCELSDNLVYIDFQTQRYLSMEKKLWETIQHSNDQQQKLDNIYSMHKTFFDDTFSNFATKEDITLYFLIDKYPFADIVFKSRYEWSFMKRHILNNDTVDVTNGHRDLIISKSKMGLSTANDRWSIIHNASLKANYFEDAKKSLENQRCSTYVQMIHSSRLLLFQFYNDFATVRLQTYVLLQLSYMFFTVYEGRNHKTEAAELRSSLIDQLNIFQNKVKDTIKTSSGDSYRCDQSFNIQSDPINQVTNLIQGYVDNEVNLNNDNSCQSSCSDYHQTKTYGCSEETYCREKEANVCNGDIRDCKFIEGDLNICHSWVGHPHKRYSGITFGSGKQIGKIACTSQTWAKSWWRWFVQCSYCFCYCDDSTISDRYFSLRPVFSDIEKNKVITAVVLQKTNRIFHWRILDDVLIPNGRTNLTNEWLTWQKWDQFNLSDSINGVDYHSLTYEHRSINLDTIVAPAGSTITGIRFNVFEGHLNLELRATKFNFDSGKLSKDHQWLSNKSPNRSQLKLISPDILLDSDDYYVANTELNKYVTFQPTDVDKDTAQHTVPFVDSYSAGSNEKSYLLSGIGIFWKGKPGSGGLISPKLVSYDYSDNIGLGSILN